MSTDVSTAESVRGRRGPLGRFQHWLSLRGDRHVVAAGTTLTAVATTYVLIRAGVLAVGPSSYASTLFASGIMSGMLTLVTVALSINQLILSRVFGSPNGLADRLDGTRELRERVRTKAGLSTTPSDPATFLSMLARTLADQAETFESALDDAGWSGSDEVYDYARGIQRYGSNIDDHVEDGSTMVDVLDIVLGTEYAHNIVATEHVRNTYGDSLSERCADELSNIDDLLESIAVSRQFFKTISLQQDMARLSRLIAFTGFVAVGTTVWLTLLYRSNGLTIPASSFPVVFSLGIGVLATPLSFFIAYIVRAATIARQTVSVGPFVPPQERSD